MAATGTRFRRAGDEHSYFDEKFGRDQTEWMKCFCAFLLGRRAYRIFAGSLLEPDLVDGLRVWQFPVVLGTGKRLFRGRAIPLTFRLVESLQTPPGAVLHVFERAGKLRYGEVEAGRETRVFD